MKEGNEPSGVASLALVWMGQTPLPSMVASWTRRFSHPLSVKWRHFEVGDGTKVWLNTKSAAWIRANSSTLRPIALVESVRRCLNWRVKWMVDRSVCLSASCYESRNQQDAFFAVVTFKARAYFAGFEGTVSLAPLGLSRQRPKSESGRRSGFWTNQSIGAIQTCF